MEQEEAIWGSFGVTVRFHFLHHVPVYFVNLFILTDILSSMCNTLVKEFVKL